MSLPLWEECAWYVDEPEECYEENDLVTKEEIVEELDFVPEHTVEELEDVALDEPMHTLSILEKYGLFDDLNIDRVPSRSATGTPQESVKVETVQETEAVDSERYSESPIESNALSLNALSETVDTNDSVLETNLDVGVLKTNLELMNRPSEPLVESIEAPLSTGECLETEPLEDISSGEVDEEHGQPEIPCGETEVFDIAIEIAESDEDEPPPPHYIFPINRSINRRMFLYLGEIYKLPCDAIVVGQVESLTDRNDGNDVIFTLAGIELEPELMLLAPCTTGDSVVTSGWQMPCEWIIHSVGPKYDERYLNASDHALFSAYKSALLLAAEKEVQSLVIGTIYKHSKKYPRFEAAHVALRTVRKFLEHSVGDVFDRVMFCVNTQDDFEIYSALMHAYFPRSEEELQDQVNLLPIQLGDEWGEVIIADRVVKVSSGPKPLPAESLQQYKASEEAKDSSAASTPTGPLKMGNAAVKAVGVAPRSMTQCDHDPDYARKKKVNAEFAVMSREERMRLRFQAMAKGIEDEEDLDDMDALHLIHFLGKDFKDRTIVYLSGPNLMLTETMDMNRVLLYLIKRMEPMRCLPFVLIYGCHTLGEAYYPDTNFMQCVFDLFSYRYKENLMKFYILHASFSFRMYFWLLLPLETTTFWSSYTNLTNLRSLRHYTDVTSLDLPEYLLRYDRDNYVYS